MVISTVAFVFCLTTTLRFVKGGEKNIRNIPFKTGADAKPWSMANGNGFNSAGEAMNWVNQEIERRNCFFTTSECDDFEGVFFDAYGDNFEFIADGNLINGKKGHERGERIVRDFMNIEEFKINSNQYINHSQFSVRFSTDVKIKYRSHPITVKIRTSFNPDGTLKLIKIKSGDDSIKSVFGEAASGAFGAAFSVTGIVGDFADYVGIEDVYLKYITYIFFTVLIGCSVIVVLLTMICMKIVFWGSKSSKNTKQYKPIINTDTDF